MILLISHTSGVAYRHAIKPLLFRFHPDTVHDHMTSVGQRTQRSRVASSILHHSWAYHNDAYLAQEVAGIRFTNPIGLSAGFDQNFSLPPLLKSIGFGFMEGGSLTYHECPGNPRPWFHRLPKTKSLVVYKGLANHGASKSINRIKSYPSNTFDNFPLNVSVARTNLPIASNDTDAIEDYIGSLRLLNIYDVGALHTINISCPNTYGGEPFNVPDKLERLLSAIDELHSTKPLFIKMPSDLSWSKFNALLKVASTHAVTGITIHNLAKDRSKVVLHDPLPDHIKGNLSGKPTWETSNELIKKTRLAYGDRFVIIGVGGVFSAEDAYTKIKLGANLVELITGMIFEGPQLIGQINRGLVRLLKRDGYTNVSQAVGADLRN